jgi:hypothetical protein
MLVLFQSGKVKIYKQILKCRLKKVWVGGKAMG